MWHFLISPYFQLYGLVFFRFFQFFVFLDIISLCYKYFCAHIMCAYILYAVSCNLSYNSESFISFKNPRQSKYCHTLWWENTARNCCFSKKQILSYTMMRKYSEEFFALALWWAPLNWTGRLAFGRHTRIQFQLFCKFLKALVTPITITTI